jgi:hypothetical protein
VLIIAVATLMVIYVRLERRSRRWQAAFLAVDHNQPESPPPVPPKTPPRPPRRGSIFHSLEIPFFEEGKSPSSVEVVARPRRQGLLPTPRRGKEALHSWLDMETNDFHVPNQTAHAIEHNFVPSIHVESVPDMTNYSTSEGTVSHESPITPIDPAITSIPSPLNLSPCYKKEPSDVPVSPDVPDLSYRTLRRNVRPPFPVRGTNPGAIQSRRNVTYTLPLFKDRTVNDHDANLTPPMPTIKPGTPSLRSRYSLASLAATLASLIEPPPRAMTKGDSNLGIHPDYGLGVAL